MRKKPIFITTDHDKGQGYKDYAMVHKTVICDGCNVIGPWEHRCHGLNASVQSEPIGRPCECQICNDEAQS